MYKKGCSTQIDLFELGAISAERLHEEKSEKNYLFDIVDALSAPVLTFSPHWSDLMPERILKIIPICRMISLKRSEELATYAECVAYMFTATLEAPMHSEWTDIYTHISCKICEEWFKENHWETVNAPRELTDWLQSKLNRLRRHIYNKRRDILRARLHQQEKYQKNNLKESIEPEVIPNQSLLF